MNFWQWADNNPTAVILLISVSFFVILAAYDFVSLLVITRRLEIRLREAREARVKIFETLRKRVDK